MNPVTQVTQITKVTQVTKVTHVTKATWVTFINLIWSYPCAFAIFLVTAVTQVTQNMIKEEIKWWYNLILAVKIYNFLGYSSYTGYTALKTNFKDWLIVENHMNLIWS